MFVAVSRRTDESENATICAAEWAKASKLQRRNLRCEKTTAAGLQHLSWRLMQSSEIVVLTQAGSNVRVKKIMEICLHQNCGMVDRKHDWITEQRIQK